MNLDVNEIGLDQLKEYLPERLSEILDRPGDGPALIVTELPATYSPESVSPKAGEPKTLEQRLWQLVGIYYIKSGRLHDAITIFQSLYSHMLVAQDRISARVHKGMPLIHISDCYRSLNFMSLSKRYLMLTLVEDVLSQEGDLDLKYAGVTRLTAFLGMPSSEFQRYCQEIFNLYNSDPILSRYPEWILQELDQEWKTEVPALQEASTYIANSKYISFLLSQLGDRSGKPLENMADYLLSSIPGCRTMRRKRSASTEYDIVCSIDGSRPDFLSETGRYFVCECKDTIKPASYSTIAKFTRVLDSTKSNFGIIFSPNGISGRENMRYAERERIKVFQDRGIAILILDYEDFKFFADGGSFLSRLRAKYESLRLDLLEYR